MKAGLCLTVFLLTIAPFQAEALSCCFVDLFCSKMCLTEGFLTAGSPRILNRGLRSVFALRRAHDVSPKDQMDSDFLSRVRRNIHIQQFSKRLFTPTQHISRGQDLKGTRKLGLLEKIAGSR